MTRKKIRMKKLILLSYMLLSGFLAIACPVCERQQPKVLQGIVHGAGPDSNWDYLIVSVMLAIALFTLFFSIKWMMRPGEKSGSHIKRYILNID